MGRPHWDHGTGIGAGLRREAGQGAEGLDDGRGETRAIAGGEQLVAGALDGEQFGTGRNELESGAEFFERAEGVTGAGGKQGRGMQTRKVLGPQLIGTPRRMERIGKQQQGLDKVGFRSGEHGRLAASVGVAAEEEASWAEAAESGDGIAQTGLILGGAVAGRPVGAELAEGKIAAKDGAAGGAEGVGEGNQKRSLAVGPGSVREDEPGSSGNRGAMQEAADGRSRGGVGELGNGGGRVHRCVDGTSAERGAEPGVQASRRV